MKLYGNIRLFLTNLINKTLYKDKHIIFVCNNFETFYRIVLSFIPEQEFYGYHYRHESIQIAKEYSRDIFNAKMIFSNNRLIFRFDTVSDKMQFMVKYL